MEATDREESKVTVKFPTYILGLIRCLSMRKGNINRKKKKNCKGEDSEQREETAEMMNSISEILNLRCLWDI